MCISPIWLPIEKLDSIPKYIRANSKYLLVPCGRCPECKRKRHNTWFVRLYLEDKFKSSNNEISYFFTLTYRDKDVPNSYNRVRLDCQAFRKSVRRYLGAYFGCDEYNFRYFITTERGNLNGRIHVHGIAFNLPCSLEVFNSIALKAWDKGFILVVPASAQHFHYVSKYVTKDISLSNPTSLPDNDEDLVNFLKSAFTHDDEQVFTSFSKRPPLGHKVLSEALKSKIAFSKDSTYRINGFTYSLPRHLYNLCHDEKRKERKLNKYAKECRIEFGTDKRYSPHDSDYVKDKWLIYGQTVKKVRHKKQLEFNKRQAQNET